MSGSYLLGLVFGFVITIPFIYWWAVRNTEELAKDRTEVKRKQEQRESNNLKIEGWKSYANECLAYPLATEKELVLATGLLQHLTVIEAVLKEERV